MKRTFVTLSLLLLTAPLASFASDQIVPAGSLIQCMVAEPKLSSKTTAIGDPVLCRISHLEQYGHSVLPYDSYLVGRFEDYKDPGHFVGKGWMELKFDRIVIEPDTIIPISAKVVSVPKYNVDKEGRILGNGHPVRDVVEWTIPVLWPIDLINLPRRGPRPVLKPETRLTLKLMDDVQVPGRDQAPHQAALVERTPQPVYAPQPAYAPPPPPQQVIYQYAPPPVIVRPRVVYQYPPPPIRVMPPPYGYAYQAPAPAAYVNGYGYPPSY